MLFLKIPHLVLYLAIFIMTGLVLPLFLVATSLCDRSISSFSIASPISSWIVSITSSSVFPFFYSGRPWISKQFLLEYCSCLSKLPFKDCIVADISLTFFCRSLIIFSFSTLPRSNSSNFSQTKSTVSFKSIRCCSPLIWLILVSSALLWMPSIFFSTFLIQLYKILTWLGEDLPSVKTSSGLLELFKLPSRIF